MLRSTRKPPKIRRRNVPTERRTDGRTDRPSYRGASQQRERAKRKKSEVLKLEERNKEEIGDEREEPSSHNEMASVRLVCARERPIFRMMKMGFCCFCQKRIRLAKNLLYKTRWDEQSEKDGGVGALGPRLTLATPLSVRSSVRRSVHPSAHPSVGLSVTRVFFRIRENACFLTT